MTFYFVGWHLYNNWNFTTARFIQKGNFRRKKRTLTSQRVFLLATEEIVIAPPKPPKDISCTKYKAASNMYKEEVVNSLLSLSLSIEMQNTMIFFFWKNCSLLTTTLTVHLFCWIAAKPIF